MIKRPCLKFYFSQTTANSGTPKAPSYSLHIKLQIELKFYKFGKHEAYEKVSQRWVDNAKNCITAEIWRNDRL